MLVQQIRNNLTQITHEHTEGRFTIYFSYTTPVSIIIDDTLYQTNTFFSNTTAGHLAHIRKDFEESRISPLTGKQFPVNIRETTQKQLEDSIKWCCQIDHSDLHHGKEILEEIQ